MLGAQSFSQWTTGEVPWVPFKLQSPWWGEDGKRKRCLWSCVLSQGHLWPAAALPKARPEPSPAAGVCEAAAVGLEPQQSLNSGDFPAYPLHPSFLTRPGAVREVGSLQAW